MASKLPFNTRFAHTKLLGIKFDPENNPKDVSLTQQSFGYETDINNIVKGMVPTTVNNKQPLFGVKIDPNSYTEALNVIADAKSKFEELPSHVRQEFDNDPHKLLEFVNDDKNYDKAVKLGLISKKAENLQQPVQTPVQGTVTPSGETVTEVSSQ